jgi:hypothetical protein
VAVKAAFGNNEPIGYRLSTASFVTPSILCKVCAIRHPPGSCALPRTQVLAELNLLPQHRSWGSPARGGPLGRTNQGEPLPPAGARSSRDHPVSSTQAPAPAQATPDYGVTVVTTAHPLFALSSNLLSADQVSALGQILYKLSKSLSMDIPIYGEGDSAKRICFNFTTDGWCKCLGMVQAGKQKKCYHLHLTAIRSIRLLQRRHSLPPSTWSC